MSGSHLFTIELIIPPASTKLKAGCTGFTSSVRLSVCPSVCGQNRVRSVSSTILVGSISYLHILSSNVRMCVACKYYWKIPKFEFLANVWNLQLWLCLFMTWDLMWITSMGNHGAAGGISDRRRSSYSSWTCQPQTALLEQCFTVMFTLVQK